MKIEIECQCCHQKVKCENHCSLTPCFNCGEWIYFPSGEKVNFEERNKLYEETYFGKDKE